MNEEKRVFIVYYLDGSEFTSRSRCFVPRIGDEIRFSNPHGGVKQFRISGVVWNEIVTAPADVEIELEEF